MAMPTGIDPLVDAPDKGESSLLATLLDDSLNSFSGSPFFNILFFNSAADAAAFAAKFRFRSFLHF